MRRVLKFLSLSPRERRLLSEAVLYLITANICIKLVSFRYIDNFLKMYSKPSPERHVCASTAQAKIDNIRRSIVWAANLLPWNSLCLSRSIVAFIMLHQRKIPAQIFFGVNSGEGRSLRAHAWVEAENYNFGKNEEEAAFTTVLTIGSPPSLDRGLHPR